LKWTHTNHLKFNMVVGSRDQRTRALLRDADIYLINYENLRWLSDTLRTHFISKEKPIPFQGIVWDELSKMKNSSTHRVNSFMKLYDQFKWYTGLTGTPASNGYKDLHGQFLVLDGGVRLGKSKHNFKGKFYKKVGPFTEVPYPDTEDRIKNLIGDITLEMSAEDYNPLPNMMTNTINIELPKKMRIKYEQLEEDLFFQLETGEEVEVFNQAALTNKCLQFSQGAVYPISGIPIWEKVHDLKLDALEDIIEESGGKPILCAYAYRSDAERIMDRFSELRPINLTACKTDRSLQEALLRWKSGDCQLMIAHPASAGFGIDGLQEGGTTLVWFGLTWSLDLYEQFNARICRQGQTNKVVCHHITTIDTIDEAQQLALESKATTQSELRKTLKQYRLEKLNSK